MKQQMIIKAYKAAETLRENTGLPTETLWGLYLLRKKLRPHVEFQAEREESLRLKYLPAADENGRIHGEDYRNYLEDLRQLNELDVETDGEKIEIPVVAGMTLRIMEDLDPFVEFTAPDTVCKSDC